MARTGNKTAIRKVVASGKFEVGTKVWVMEDSHPKAKWVFSCSEEWRPDGVGGAKKSSVQYVLLPELLVYYKPKKADWYDEGLIANTYEELRDKIFPGIKVGYDMPYSGTTSML